jgi:hypothetical protein
MNRATILLCALAFTAVAAAQNAQPIRVAPIAPAPATQAAQVQPAPAVDAAAEAAHDEAAGRAVETVESLRAANKALREKVRSLREENAGLKDRIAQMTSRGGSEVRAYCPTNTLSRNTAGAENDCSASGYTCESVSGLCRTVCRTSDMCAGGFTCDVDAGVCVNTSGGVPDSDG